MMREELYWGGKGLGVYRNNQLKAPTMKALADGLWGMNAWKKYSSRNGNRTSKHGRAY